MASSCAGRRGCDGAPLRGGEHHQGELERLHGDQLLPSHRQALQAMRRCRRQGGDLMVLHCSDCNHRLKVPHSCGHRSCPHCQHKDSQRWIERQQAKLLRWSIS